MRRNRERYLISTVLLLLLQPVFAASAQDLRDPRFVERAQVGFADMFNLDYDKADRVFTALEQEYPQHPAPPLYLACIYWLDELLRRQDLSMNRFIAPTYFANKSNQVMPQRERSLMFRNLQKSEALASQILKRNSRDKDGRYFLATCYGLRASFAITIDHSLREAFSNGNKAYGMLRQLVEEDPKYYDAYLTVGIYEYIVGSIPWYLRWMAFVIGAHGNKEIGVEHLKLAADKGQYIRNEAQLVEMVLFVREHRYQEALDLALSLNNRYPRTFLFALNVAQILEWMGRKEEATAAFLQVEKRVEAKEPNFDKLPVQSFRYSLAVELMNMGQLALAEVRFRKVVDDPLSPAKEKSDSHLRLGQILEWRGRQGEAAEEFRKAKQ
jgi:tetratricopeptide (TPR) repeat protein